MIHLILECVVRSVLMAFGTAIALYVLKVKAARVRHAVWASVVVLMLVLPVWTAWGPKAVLRVLTPAPSVADTQTNVVQETSTERSPTPVVRAVWTWQNSLLAFYLLGFGVLGVRLLTGTVRTWMLIRRAGKRAGRLTSDSCVTPITVGWFTPSVILPRSWTGWSRAQLDAVLAHEDEHARRRDPLVQWLALLNRAVFWFHPPAWWLSRQVSALAEEACDDAVLVRGHDPLCYSEYLLGLARVVQESGARVGVVGMAMPGTFLPQRIRRIAAGVEVQRVSRLRIAGVAVSCVVVSTVFTVGAIGYARAGAVERVAESEISAPVEFAVPLLHSRGSEGLARTTSGLPGVASDGLSRTTNGLPRKRVLLAQATVPVASPTGQSISGIVMDPSGAVVADAPVTLTDTDTGSTASTTSDNTGRYWFRNIGVGTYSVTLSVRGFKRLTQTGMLVAAGEAHNAGTMFLALGTVADSVSVMGSRSAPIVSVAPDQKSPNSAATMFHRLVGEAGPGGPARIGGDVQAARLVNHVRPTYPANLQQQGVEGTVKISAVISKDGLPIGLQVVSSPDPGLTQAALEAVTQWRYQPTLLNGQPVETVTTMDVNFSLK